MFDIATNIDCIKGILTQRENADDYSDCDNRNGCKKINVDYVDDDDDADDYNNLNLSDNEEHEKEKQKLILLETQHGVDNEIYLIYKILNSKDKNNFLIIQELESDKSDQWNKERPVELMLQTLSQVVESVAYQSKKKSHVSSVKGDEPSIKHEDPCVKRDEPFVNKKRKNDEIRNDKNRTRHGIKGGIIKGYKIENGYGFVQEDETGENIFFHTSRKLEKEWIPHIGERVEYKLQYDNTKKRETAVDVAVVYTKEKFPRSNFPASQEFARKYTNCGNNQDRHAQGYSAFFDIFDQANHRNYYREDARAYNENCKLPFPKLSMYDFL